jgi:hypothetical protein
MFSMGYEVVAFAVFVVSFTADMGPACPGLPWGWPWIYADEH